MRTNLIAKGRCLAAVLLSRGPLAILRPPPGLCWERQVAIALAAGGKGPGDIPEPEPSHIRLRSKRC